MKEKDNRKQIEQREDELAEQEYGRPYVDLPGDIKANIHNEVLREMGLKRTFTMTCLDCGKLFEEDVEGALVEIYTEIQSESDNPILESCCPDCKAKKEKQAEEEELSLWKEQ